MKFVKTSPDQNNPLSALRLILHQYYYRGQRTNANFFCTEIFENSSGHRRPHQKLWTSTPKSGFPAAPVMARNLLSPGHPCASVRNVGRKLGLKSLCFKSADVGGQMGILIRGSSGKHRNIKPNRKKPSKIYSDVRGSFCGEPLKG